MDVLKVGQQNQQREDANSKRQSCIQGTVTIFLCDVFLSSAEMSVRDHKAVKIMLVDLDVNIEHTPYTAPPGEEGGDLSHEGGEHEAFEGLAQKITDLSGL